MFSRYSSVSDMLDVLGWLSLSQRRQEARLILFYKIINGMAQVALEGILVEAYKGARRKHNMKFSQIGHTTCQYGQSFFLNLLVHGTGLLSLKLHHWLYLDQIFLTISMHPFRIIPYRRVLRNNERETAKYILSVYSPFSDRVGLPLHNTPFPGVLMKSIGAAFYQPDALPDVNHMREMPIPPFNHVLRHSWVTAVMQF